LIESACFLGANNSTPVNVSIHDDINNCRLLSKNYIIDS
jgi:hypothetical protein